MRWFDLTSLDLPRRIPGTHLGPDMPGRTVRATARVRLSDPLSPGTTLDICWSTPTFDQLVRVWQRLRSDTERKDGQQWTGTSS
jgi:hypothetical protein